MPPWQVLSRKQQVVMQEPQQEARLVVQLQERSLPQWRRQKAEQCLLLV